MQEIWLQIKTRVYYSVLSYILIIIILFEYKEVLLLFFNLELIYTDPLEPLKSNLYLLLFFGNLIILPILLYHCYYFLLPGLYQYERLQLRQLIIITLGLYYSYTILFFSIILPSLLYFFYSFEAPTLLYFYPKLLEIISFVLYSYLYSSIIILLPVIFYIIFLYVPSFYKHLIYYRRIYIFIILLISSIISPADFVSFIFYCVPIFFFFELSILFLSLLYSLSEIKSPSLKKT